MSERKSTLRIEAMRAYLAEGYSFAQIARMAGVSRQYIARLLTPEVEQVTINIPFDLSVAITCKIGNRHRMITRHEWIIRALARKAEYKLPPKRSWK